VALGASPLLSLLALFLGIVTGVVSIIVSGAYPFMVKAAVDHGQLSISDAMGRAFHKFWSLLGAALLVGLLVAMGTIALVVPGLILATWYAYTVPAIVLEDKGALQGMAASKAFGRDKKWSTFLIGVAIVVVAFIVVLLDLGFALGGLGLLGRIIVQILFVPISAWAGVIVSYTYISCGPSSVPTAAGAAAPGTMPPAQQPAMGVGSPATHFCPACGSPVEVGARFCRNCGKAL